jgi:hypothetical protein
MLRMLLIGYVYSIRWERPRAAEEFLIAATVQNLRRIIRLRPPVIPQTSCFRPREQHWPKPDKQGFYYGYPPIQNRSRGMQPCRLRSNFFHGAVELIQSRTFSTISARL